MRRLTTILISLTLLIGLTSGMPLTLYAQDDPTQREANKSTVRRYYEEVLSQNRPELVDELFGQSYVLHLGTEDLKGLADKKAFVTTLKTAFPDGTWTVHDVLAEGHYVAARVSVTATQEGMFNGTPATGNRVENVPSMAMFRLEDGKIVEAWSQDNFLVLAQQLGTAPAPFGVPVFTDPGSAVGAQTDTATHEANKSIVTQLLAEGWSQGNLDVVNQLYAPDAVIHPTAGGQAPEVAGIGLEISTMRLGLPDMTLTIDLMIAEGDEVATLFTLSGTNTGGVYGLPPTDTFVTTSGIRIDRIVNGKIVETWQIIDVIKIYQDLGVFDTATPAASPSASPIASPEATPVAAAGRGLRSPDRSIHVRPQHHQTCANSWSVGERTAS